MRRPFRILAVFLAVIVLFAAVSVLVFRGTAASAISVPEAPAAAAPASTEDKLRNAIVMYVGSPMAFVNGSEAFIDPLDPEVSPVIMDNVRLAPLRFIAESLGVSVEWDQTSETAAITVGGTTFGFKQNSDIMTVGEKSYKLDITVQAVKGRTFVPLNKLVEVLGREVFYDKGLIIISDIKNILDPVLDRSSIDDIISQVSYLPTVGSREKMMELLTKLRSDLRNYGYDDGMRARKSIATDTAVAQEAKAETSNGKMDGSDSNPGNADYSTTNVQVLGVDEADVVKTDGEYIYQVNKQRVVIARAYPPENMEVVSITDFGESSLVPLELYLHGKRMVVIGESDGLVKAVILDITDGKSVKQLRSVELEGNYVSSRKIGSFVYLVANKHLDYYRIQEGDPDPRPLYRDSLEGGGLTGIDYDSIRYFPGMLGPNCLIIAGIDVDGDSGANVSAYLGAGQHIYASTENLYVAAAYYKAPEVKPVSVTDGSTMKVRIMPEYNDSTLIYKFSLRKGNETFLGKGEVPGRILNQFSMDESGGYFRIATTQGQPWRGGEFTSKNNLYVLDDMLSITGKIEDIAPGERIYSVRFMGDRAYMVTFEKVDPLFVIDLKDPGKPSILGALKIPGYSDYLHPYDENHIIGFGKDTVEIKDQAYYQGMKIAIFDVTDVANPKQEFTEIIGARGTDSEMLRNHKALLFSKEKGLMAFPVTVMEVKGENQGPGEGMLQYGQFAFQGAYVYNIDLAKGFTLKGKITHLSPEDYLKAGSGWYESDKNVSRILYINDTLYTLSNSMFKAHGLSDMEERNTVAIP